MEEKISVLLVDDHAVVRQGLRALLQTEPDITVVGEAENGRQAVTLAAELRPNVVVMDVAMPLLNGAEATRQITREHRGAKVLVLSSYSDEESVDQLMRAGAAGYLVKQTAANELIKAIHEVQRGNAFFSPAIAKHLSERCRAGYKPSQPGARGSDLTPRECEVLQLIAEGFANKQIAAELGISIKTVEKHRQGLMTKLGIHETAGLTRYALAKGVVEATRPPEGTAATNNRAPVNSTSESE